MSGIYLHITKQTCTNQGRYREGRTNRLEIGELISMYEIQKRWWDDNRAREHEGHGGRPGILGQAAKENM
jgi:hypothetical protein